MSELFAPLEHLLVCGGDSRLIIDPVDGLNTYGCQPVPSPHTLNVASSTATSISERAYARAALARDALMRSAIAVGLDDAFDARIEAMRGELKACLDLSDADVDVIFSPSGTDSQLHALFIARSLLGPGLTTLVVAADQTGSGTAYTARGRHFSDRTANGCAVRKDEPIAGLSAAVDSVALPLFDGAGDPAVLGAIETAIAGGANVLLQVMDASKLGWRAPSDQCLDAISARWPERVRIVVDACQMRLSRRRLRRYLDRGYMVLVTGSKYFAGPAFSGALLVPASVSRGLDQAVDIAAGLLDYSTRSDWPAHWTALRSQFPVRPNFGQWLRWEAALEEIRAYYAVPDAFRRSALAQLGAAIENIIASSPSLRLLATRTTPAARSGEDEEFAQATIFPFVIERDRRSLSPIDCRAVYRALARDARDIIAAAGNDHDRDIAAQVCLVGQPVGFAAGEGHSIAALRICIGARAVIEAWSTDADVAQRNLQRERDRIAVIVAKIELLVAQAGQSEAVKSEALETSYGV
jgi:hypothetical protein